MQTLVQKYDDFCGQIDMKLINVHLQYWSSQGGHQGRHKPEEGFVLLFNVLF